MIPSGIVDAAFTLFTEQKTAVLVASMTDSTNPPLSISEPVPARISRSRSCFAVAWMRYRAEVDYAYDKIGNLIEDRRQNRQLLNRGPL